MDMGQHGPVGLAVLRIAGGQGDSSHADSRLTTSPTTATAIAWVKPMGTGLARRSTLSQPISSATSASTTALAKPTRSPSLPVPKVKRGLWTFLRA